MTKIGRNILLKTNKKTEKKVRQERRSQNILGDIQNKKASEIKRELLVKFGRTKYYQFYRSEKPLFPSDQQIFAKIFQKNGIETEIKYERFSEDYDWSY